jgi:hypothetical protein
MKKYRLPKPLADFYAAHAPLFAQVRDIRTDIEHHGKRIPTVFEMPDGFGILAKGSPAWSGRPVWKQVPLEPNDIGSVDVLSKFLARSVLTVLDDLEAALVQLVSQQSLPKALFDGNRVYLKNPLIGNLSQLAG